MTIAREFLSANGRLAERLNGSQQRGFQHRPQQERMAEAVELALASADRLIVEAGTGVGKTFAYLLPALLSGKKVIISTGTKHLQDQLYRKDLPLLREVLDVPVKTALLKGRANYLCLHRLNNALADPPRDPMQIGALRRIQTWSKRTRSGDISEVAGVPEDSRIWPRVTSTADNCLGAECPVFQQCHLVKARRGAQESDLVVINHHLFFADLALKQEGFGEVLPSADAFILDEAHQLPEVATSFFGSLFSSRQLLDLAGDTVAGQLREAPDMAELRNDAQALEWAVGDFRLGLGEAEQRAPWPAKREQSEVAAALDTLEDVLQALNNGLEMAAERGKGLQACHRRAVLLIERLELLRANVEHAVQWFETFARGFILHHTPLDIAAIFRGHMDRHPCAWIFTSATLAVNGRFEHFTGRLGIEDARCLQLDSPYDYAHHAVLYLPQGLPDPSSSAHTQAVIEVALPVLRASRGRAFLLFTSHRALARAARLLTGRLPYPLLVQGTAPRPRLLEQFRAAGDAVLLGTSSFWEGVDVRGAALSCVIIDKLPFASIGEPVLRARIEALRANGKDPFHSLQLPHAVVALKQGVGRLIRDAADTGVLMICDPRLKSRPYGRLFLNSLPPIPLTQQLKEVEEFFINTQQAYETASN